MRAAADVPIRAQPHGRGRCTLVTQNDEVLFEQIGDVLALSIRLT